MRFENWDRRKWSREERRCWRTFILFGWLTVAAGGLTFLGWIQSGGWVMLIAGLVFLAFVGQGALISYRRREALRRNEASES